MATGTKQFLPPGESLVQVVPRQVPTPPAPNVSLRPDTGRGVWQREWVVHCKPVGNGQTALKYLAPYVYRVAISNRRLIKWVDTGSMETSRITFQYRASDTGQLKLCTLPAEKFIHRFLQHVLPKGFVKSLP